MSHEFDGGTGGWSPPGERSLAVRAPGARPGGRALRPVGALRERGVALAKALGWFSLGLGLSQVVAPGRVARLLGLSDDAATRRTMRLVGMRELWSGVGLLSRRRPARFAWARVGGDLLDAALLGRALRRTRREAGVPVVTHHAVAYPEVTEHGATQQAGRRVVIDAGAPEHRAPHPGATGFTVTAHGELDHVVERARRRRLGAGLAAVLGAGALDVVCATRLSGAEGPEEGSTVHVTRAITINRPVDEVRRAWDEGRGLASLRRATREGGAVIGFTEAPGGRGTEVSVDLEARVVGGKLGETAARLMHRAPDQKVAEELRAFKAWLETGVPICSDATLHRGKHPAQPSA